MWNARNGMHLLTASLAVSYAELHINLMTCLDKLTGQVNFTSVAGCPCRWKKAPQDASPASNLKSDNSHAAHVPIAVHHPLLRHHERAHDQKEVLHRLPADLPHEGNG